MKQVTSSGGIQFFKNRFSHSRTHSLTTGSLIITISRGKPHRLVWYKCEGWSLCCQLVQFESSKGNFLFKFFPVSLDFHY